MWTTVCITFAVAILSGLGVGSAGLLVVWLTIVKNTPQLIAQGLNLVFFVLSSGAALTVHLFRTPLLWECMLFLIPSGLFGSFMGAALTTVLPQALLRRAFGVLLIVSGTMALFSPRSEKKRA